MTKYKNGPLGPFSGKLGDKVYSSWKNDDVVKDAPEKTTKEPTQRQLEQREKFSLLTAFFSCIYDVIAVGFQAFTYKMTQMNAAMKFNTDIITGVSPNFSIDYPKVLISKGKLNGPIGVKLKCDASGQMKLSWEFQAECDQATDRACILFYDESINDCFIISGIVRREDAALLFFKQHDAIDDLVHVWLFFISANGRKVSNSVYAGNG
ncbi:DUF6266 family protein [Pedobacter hartonius]|uniref:Uncharacterized protein n=1 Tax=Pedobacter hartonius TaxID=425514 RepID=A0A1H4B753_9SPHI|nr:DUF6266 family protein [Pedobacter hartonius]SEA43936.1 hypothetical protein SAMN05443550_103230 [Pedobacter hartonius]